MPKIKGASIIDTVLNEYVYTAIYRANYEDKRGLKGKYLKAATNEKAARNFAENSTLEEKMIVLSHLGYEYYFILNGAGKQVAHLKEYLPNLEAGKKSAANKAISEDGLFVTSDRQILRAAGLVSRTIHHPSYYMDLEILRQGYNIAKWKKRYGGSKDSAFREADETARVINKLMLNTLLNSDQARGLIDCAKNELLILQYLYSASGDVTEDQLDDFFMGRMSKREYRYALKYAVADNLAQRVSKVFIITGSGIKKVNDFFHSVIHSNNF